MNEVILASPMQKKQTNNINNGKGAAPTTPTNVTNAMKGHLNNFLSVHFNIYKEWKKFWEKLNAWKLTQEKTENLNSPTSVGGTIYKPSYTENSQGGSPVNSSKYLSMK